MKRFHVHVGVRCCYAQSDKHWISDPQGVARESFRSLGSVPFYGDDAPAATASSATPSVGACCGRG